MKLNNQERKKIINALKNQKENSAVVDDLIARFEQSVGMTKSKAEKNKPGGFDPDWGGKCDICDSSPTVSGTGMCGPCTFGEADTAGGNW